MIKAHWYDSVNVGDTLTPIVVKHFTNKEVVRVDEKESGKLLGVGSIMQSLKKGDTVWGSGSMFEGDNFSKIDCTVLATRGKLTELQMAQKPGVYGDPALLLPLIYNPEVEKTTAIGIVPHYVDMKRVMQSTAVATGAVKIIDVLTDWQSFIREVKSCETIISSSLHGIIIAEAYGIPAEWTDWSDEVWGKGFKFRDYLTGTGRAEQVHGKFPPIEDLARIQDRLINSLQKHYDCI